MMKHIKYIIFLSILMQGFNCYADTIQLRIPDSTFIAGNIIDMPIYVDSSLTGENVYSYQFQISYTNICVDYLSLEVTGTISEVWGAPLVNSNTPGILSIAGAGTIPLSGTGVLFYIKFYCIQNCNCYIEFDGGDANNFFNEHSPPVILEDSYLYITPAPSIHVTPENGLLSIGEELQFSVSGGTPPYSWFSTNPSVASINSSGLLTALGTGFTLIVAEDDTGIRDTINEVVEVRPMKLSIPDTSAWQGNIIDIPVYTTDLTGLNIISGNFSLSFNENVLSGIGYENSGTLLEDYSNILLNNSTPGELSVIFAGTSPLQNDGILLYLQFEVSTINSYNTYITFTDALFNEDILAKTERGLFSTISFANINITPSTLNIVAGEKQQFTASGGIFPYIWQSSDNSVASIDETGLLTAHQSGIIQVSVSDSVGATGISGDINVFDTYVHIPEANAILNTIYEIPVLLSGLPNGQTIFSIQGKIGFKSPELIALDIITLGTSTDGWSFFKIISEDEISFACAGVTSFSDSGPMFKIRFELTSELTANEYALITIDEMIINEGIPLPYLINGRITGIEGFRLRLKSYLEGPFNSITMNTDLNMNKILPHSQPYNYSPWYYYGNENVPFIPNENIVDWVIVELRDAVDAASAISSTRIGRQAAFLTNDGSIVCTDGLNDVVIPGSITNDLHAIIWHRNHLGILSANPLVESAGIYNYDFATSEMQTFGGSSGIKELSVGTWGMISGDGNADGKIDSLDKENIWILQSGETGYKYGDYNMDVQVDNIDKNESWLPNINLGTQIPD